MLKKALFCCAAVASMATPSLAEDDKEVSILAALGLTAASGKTTLADGAGDMEGVILASAMFQAAVGALEKELRDSDKNLRFLSEPTDKADLETRPVVVLDNDDPFDMALAGFVTDKIKNATPGKPSCPENVKSTGSGSMPWMNTDDGPDIDTSRSGVAATVIGALKTDTSISSYSVTIPEHHLISSVAAEFGEDAILPNEIAVMPTAKNSTVMKAYNELMLAKEKLMECAEVEPAKTQLAKINAVDAAVTAAGEKDGPSLLERAAKQGIVANARPLLLRLNMEKAGGTVVNRSNIFLQFGFPGALVIHNGMKLNYRLVNPETGFVLNAGSILCRQPKSQRFETVYRKTLKDLRKAAVCEPLNFKVADLR